MRLTLPKFRDVSVGISVGNMSSRLCPARAAWVTTMAACIGGVFRECHPESVIAIDAVPVSVPWPTIDESPPGITPAVSTTPMARGYADIHRLEAKTRSGSTHWPEIGHQTSQAARPAMFSAVLSWLRRTPSQIIVIDTSPDLEHDVKSSAAEHHDTLVFVSGITADRSRWCCGAG